MVAIQCDAVARRDDRPMTVHEAPRGTRLPGLVNCPKKLWNDPAFCSWVNPLFRLGHFQCRKLWMFTRGYLIFKPTCFNEFSVETASNSQFSTVSIMFGLSPHLASPKSQIRTTRWRSRCTLSHRICWDIIRCARPIVPRRCQAKPTSRGRFSVWMIFCVTKRRGLFIYYS